MNGCQRGGGRHQRIGVWGYNGHDGGGPQQALERADFLRERLPCEDRARILVNTHLWATAEDGPQRRNLTLAWAASLGGSGLYPYPYPVAGGI